jgi:hypothetical protein
MRETVTPVMIPCHTEGASDGQDHFIMYNRHREADQPRLGLRGQSGSTTDGRIATDGSNA